MPLNEQQSAAMVAAVNGQHLLITGPAGTGKSYVLRDIVDELESQGWRVAITGTTGMAAVNIGGSTIHSFLGTRLYGSRTELEQALAGGAFKIQSNVYHRLNNTDTLVIDEVSMLTGDYLEMIDWWLCKVCKSQQPMAGRQIILCGDFLQLPPVVTPDRRPANLFAFQSPIWSAMDITVIQLTQSFRQADQEFVRMLLELRAGMVSPQTLQQFSQCLGRRLENPTRLFSRNDQALAFNLQKLSQVEGEETTYVADFSGNPSYWDKLVQYAPPDKELVVKQGALVLILVNDKDRQYINGTKGLVRKAGRHSLEVEIVDQTNPLRGQVVELQRHTFEYRDGDGQVLAQMHQIPCKLGWGLTIHKAQGCTLDTLQVDLSNVFTGGQAYVALSRVRSLEGLSLDTTIDPSRVYANRQALDFYMELEKYKKL